MLQLESGPIMQYTGHQQLSNPAATLALCFADLQESLLYEYEDAAEQHTPSSSGRGSFTGSATVNRLESVRRTENYTVRIEEVSSCHPCLSKEPTAGGGGQPLGRECDTAGGIPYCLVTVSWVKHS